jgi:hypothetical protein
LVAAMVEPTVLDSADDSAVWTGLEVVARKGKGPLAATMDDLRAV